MPRRTSRHPGADQLLLPLHVYKKICHHRVYYLTCEQFDLMLWRAGGRCEICGVRPEDVQKQPLNIDHDHRLGNSWDHVRGMVCCKCNHALKYVDNGFRRPTPGHQRYLKMSWFRVFLPPERQDEPFLPPPTDNPNCSTWRTSPARRRYEALLVRAKEQAKLKRCQSATRSNPSPGE